jgi:hypothetical protein
LVIDATDLGIGGQMHALEPDPHSRVGAEPEEPVRVWIENGDGSIARGLVEVLSESGALVRLVGVALVASGDEVAVRIAVSRTSPTLGGAARVRWVRPDGDTPECELEWTHSGPEREQLAYLVVSLG